MKMQQSYVDRKYRLELTLQSGDLQTSSKMGDLTVLDKARIRDILRETGKQIASIIHEAN